jgi:hypothetical protein
MEPSPLNSHPIPESTGKAARKLNRQKQRRQCTVRLDENLVKALVAVAEADGLRLTDALEEGAWMWLQRKKPSKEVVRLRFLCNVLSVRMQRLTEAFLAYIDQPRPRHHDEVSRRVIEEMLTAYREDPGSDFQGNLERLAKGPESPEPIEPISGAKKQIDKA